MPWAFQTHPAFLQQIAAMRFARQRSVLTYSLHTRQWSKALIIVWCWELCCAAERGVRVCLTGPLVTMAVDLCMAPDRHLARITLTHMHIHG